MSLETLIVALLIALAVVTAGWRLYRILTRKDSPCDSCAEHGGCPFESQPRSRSMKYQSQYPTAVDLCDKKDRPEKAARNEKHS